MPQNQTVDLSAGLQPKIDLSAGLVATQRPATKVDLSAGLVPADPMAQLQLATQREALDENIAQSPLKQAARNLQPELPLVTPKPGESFQQTIQRAVAMGRTVTPQQLEQARHQAIEEVPTVLGIAAGPAVAELVPEMEGAGLVSKFVNPVMRIATQALLGKTSSVAGQALAGENPLTATNQRQSTDVGLGFGVGQAVLGELPLAALGQLAKFLPKKSATEALQSATEALPEMSFGSSPKGVAEVSSPTSPATTETTPDVISSGVQVLNEAQDVTSHDIQAALPGKMAESPAAMSKTPVEPAEIEPVAPEENAHPVVAAVEKKLRLALDNQETAAQDYSDESVAGAKQLANQRISNATNLVDQVALRGTPEEQAQLATALRNRSLELPQHNQEIGKLLENPRRNEQIHRAVKAKLAELGEMDKPNLYSTQHYEENAVDMPVREGDALDGLTVFRPGEGRPRSSGQSNLLQRMVLHSLTGDEARFEIDPVPESDYTPERLAEVQQAKAEAERWGQVFTQTFHEHVSAGVSPTFALDRAEQAAVEQIGDPQEIQNRVALYGGRPVYGGKDKPFVDAQGNLRIGKGPYPVRTLANTKAFFGLKNPNSIKSVADFTKRMGRNEQVADALSSLLQRLKSLTEGQAVPRLGTSRLALPAFAEGVEPEYVGAQPEEAASFNGNAIPADAQARITANTKRLAAITDPNKINSPQDVSKVLNQAVSHLEQNTDPRLTQPLTAQMRRQLANELGMTEQDLLSTPIGRAHNAEQVTAARSLVNNSVQNVLRTASDAKSNPAQADAFYQALAQHFTVDEAFTRQVGKEAGRSLQAMNGGKGFTAEKLFRQIRKLDPSVRQAAIDGFLKIDPNDTGALMNFARSLKPATFGDKLHEAYLASLFSSGSAVAKTVGDSMNQLLSPFTEGLNVLLDQSKALIGKTPATSFDELSSYAKLHNWDAAKSAARRAWNELEVDTENNEFSRKVAIPGRMGRVIRAPQRYLSTVNAFMHEVNFQQRLMALSIRAARSEAATGALDDYGKYISRAREIYAQPTADMIDDASKFARNKTFQDNPEDSPGLYSDVMNLGIKIQRDKLGRFGLPVVRTPANIARETVRYSPAGFLGTTKGIITGDLAGEDLTRNLSKNLIGTAIGSWALVHTLGGNISGAGPSNPQKKAALEATGWQPYSIKVGDHWVSYRRLSPVMLALGGPANLVEQLREIGTKDNPRSLQQRIAYAMAKTASDTLSGVPFNPVTSGTSVNTNNLGKAVGESVASRLIPGAVRSVAQSVDRTYRSPQTFTEEIESRIPGLTKNVPPRVDASGQPIKRPVNALGGFNPFPASPVRNDPVLNELSRLGISAGNAPRKATASRLGLPAAEKAPSLDLTPDESKQVQQAEQTEFYNRAKMLMQSRDWQSDNAAQRKKALSEIKRQIESRRFERVQQMRTANRPALPVVQERP